MAGVPAGRLSIEIVAEIARLQSDLDKAKRAVNAASADIAKSAKAANDNLSSIGSGLSKVSGRNRAALTQLSFQLNDVATMAMSGSGVMQIFGTQAGQILQVVQQAEGGFKGLAGAILSAVAPFTPLIAAAALLGVGIGLLTGEINENSKVHVTWMDTLLGAYDAVKSYLEGELSGAFSHFGTTAGDVWTTVVEGTKWAINKIIAITQVVPRAIQDTWKLIPAGVADIFFSAVNGAIDAINSLISKSVSGVNGFINAANGILSKANMALPMLSAPQIARVQNSYAGAGAKLGNTLAKSIGTTITKDFIGDMADAISPFAQARARKRITDDAKKAGKDAGAGLGKAIKNAAAKPVEDLVASLQNDQLTKFYSDFLKDQEKQWKEFNERVGNTADDKVQQRLEADRDAAQALNDQLHESIDLLGSMGKLGQGLGAILGVLTGNTKDVRGPLGDVLNTSFQSKKDGKEIASTIGDELSKVFSDKSGFGKALTSALQGAGAGMTAASAVFGKQSSVQKIGSAIGGASGKALGTALAGPLGGAIGSIAGGLLGSVVGGLFKKVKWGAVNLTSAGVSGTSGNSSTAEKAALATGNSIFSSLTDLATQLGGAVGDFGNIAVGTRHGDYRVNTTGTSLKVNKGAVDFNDDADAAVAYAIKQAIEKGAITGIRQSTNNLLKAGDDLQTQLQKAVSFEGVFTELKASTDPIGAALDDVDKQFDQLRVIFKEAGASAEEYASLEQLLVIKRQQAMQKETDALDDVKSRIADLQGDTATVKAIERAHELRDAVSETVRTELQRLYAIEDATEAQQALTDAQTAATAAADQLKDAWSSIATDLLDEVNRIRGLTGTEDGATFAKLQGQFNMNVGLARSGDKEAAAKLVDLSQSLLTVAGDTATSRQELDRIKAQTAASLEGVYNLINAVTGNSDDTSSLAFGGTSSAAQAVTATEAVSASTDDLSAKVDQLRQDLNAGLANLASIGIRSAKVLENVSPLGDAISVASAA